MKLKNKKTGEIGELSVWRETDTGKLTGFAVIKENEKFPTDYKNLAELNEDWKDYEEPEGCWIINILGIVEYTHFRNKDEAEMLTEIGNRFETEEEAEKAVKKLRAYKRLNSCGFKFKGWRTVDLGADKHYFVITAESDGAGKGDLDLLFSEVKNE